MVIEMRRIDVGVDEANELLNQAGLASLNTMEILQGGWDNTNILLTLTDASKVVLKVWNANTIEEVRRVVARHCHLDEHGIPTAVPIEFLDGPFRTSFLYMWLAEIDVNEKITIGKNPESGKFEHDGYDWLTREEAMKMTYPYLRPFVEWAFDNF